MHALLLKSLAKSHIFLLIQMILTFAVPGKSLALFGTDSTSDVLSPNDERPIITTSGVLQGHMSSWQPKVWEYLGIRYAMSPIGNLRFAPPQAYKSATLFLADKYSVSCPQTKIGADTHLNDTSSVLARVLAAVDLQDAEIGEDCLSLNVWTTNSTGPAKAVMVYIYGGGFNTGGSNATMFNGARLANDEDVVVVSINYRLGIFGFPSAPNLASYNLGLRDQRLAIEWVRDNIAAFGGDTKRITLFGQSAGAASVAMYSYAYLEDPIATGFIAESGSIGSAGGGPLDSRSWFNTTLELGCGGAEVADLALQCMRNKSLEAIINATSSSLSISTTGPTLEFGPSVDNQIVFANYTARAITGKFIRKPMLMGSNNNEAGISGALASLGGQSVPPEVIAQMNLMFVCPVAAETQTRASVGNQIYRYRYFGDYPNLRLAPNVGTYHNAELPMVFGTSEFISGYNNTAPESETQKYMMSAWAAFAKNSEAGLSSLPFLWPIYNATGNTLIQLGVGNSSIANFTLGNMFDAGC